MQKTSAPITKTAFTEIKPINFNTSYHQGFFPPSVNSIDSHFHDKCEIYVNISGDVSFMVESRIYNICSGDVIITRPYEKHHCIYHSDALHDHFCIMISQESSEDILSPFFNRECGEGNLISLPPILKEKLLSLCKALVEEENELKKYITFFTLIDMLSGEKFSENFTRLPDDVKIAVEYIANSLSSEISVSQVAKEAHVTVNTLERHFKKCTGISPYKYIQNCRLANARAILECGGSVTGAAMASGFSDYSHFIALFKKKYKLTPLKFKKSL